ncbi:erd-2.2 [Symbiodinium necroappetens]|uniref:Erd-2.2 protein n=1 Tax=Symbiodinium necroappetens TaxID=1628268 RepID=A0A812YLV1_9DINO|nr:erd-2.2 [Symbiodinium necroappetens]
MERKSFSKTLCMCHANCDSMLLRFLKFEDLRRTAILEGFLALGGRAGPDISSLVLAGHGSDLKMLGAMFAIQQSEKKSPPRDFLAAYAIFLAGSFAVYHLVANGEFSSILTMAQMIQCLAFVLLTIKSLSQGSVAGLSAKSLGLEALAFGCRLSSTTWLNGYLPVDASGDFVYQAVEICSLCLVLFLLHRAFVSHRWSYEEEADSLPVLPMVIASLFLAALLHADMNSRPVFDTLWMAGLFLSVVSVLPQLWHIHQTGGVIQACTGHYIAMLACSRALSGIFMWHARFDITCVRLVGGFNQAIWAILGAHLLHLILLGDFGYYYVKAVMQQGLDFKIELPCADMV